MRALFRPFALHAAYTPIETIVFFCIIGTLAYFHILSAIKHSAFLDPNAPYSPYGSSYGSPYTSGAGYPTHGHVLKPAYALHRLGEWIGVREGSWGKAVKEHNSKDTVKAVEVQQIIFTVDGAVVKARSTQLILHDVKLIISHHIQSSNTEHTEQLSLSAPPLLTATQNLTKHLTTSFTTPSGETYTSFCHQTAEDKGCFTLAHPHTRTFAQTLTFRPGGRDEWVDALLGEDHSHPSSVHHSVSFTGEDGIRFEVGRHLTGENGHIPLPLAQMRNGKWVAYAVRALVVRFWDLAKVRSICPRLIRGN